MFFEEIRTLAIALGFDDLGMTQPHFLQQDAAYVDDWLAKGLHGALHYLEQNKERRYDPSVLVPAGKTILVGVVKNTHIKGDYHRHIKSLLYGLENELSQRIEGLKPIELQHIFCDSAPVLERRLAVEAGLGWIGKNRNFYHHSFGSLVHLGELMLDVVVPRKEPPEAYASRCGSCEDCINACPSGALGDEWNAQLCRAYHKEKCWICQTVCKYNAI